MSWSGFTPEWLADRERKNVSRIGPEQEKAQKAREWNGNIEPAILSHGGETASRRPHKPELRVQLSPVQPLYPIVTLCRSMKIAEPVPEHKFHPTRKFRFDYAWPMHMLALEVEGGLWTNGRHSRGSGQLADLEKYSEAAILGWRILYCTPEQLHNGIALDRIYRALTDREAA